jgi:hypothetical protein
MVTIVMATAIALGLASIVLLKSRSADPEQLIQPRAPMMTVGIQIICGNCSGEGDRPVKTYLNQYGNCAQCGGRSYLLASSVAAYGLVARAARLREAQIASTHGRVLPFEVPGSRGTRSERIAV